MKKIRLRFIRTIILAFFLWALISSCVENVEVSVEISNFTKKGVLNEEISTKTTKYYEVKAQEWQDNQTSYEKIGSKVYYGSPGDILVGIPSTFKGVPFVYEFITFFFGGHAALCAFPYEDYENKVLLTDSIEISGLSSDPINNLVSEQDRAFWSNSNWRSEIICLRVNATYEEKQMAFNQAVSNFGDPYNYSFIFNTTNTSYCSDIISKAYLGAGINLNNDKFATTIQDLIVSNKTYISLYKTVDSDNITHIYYLV